MEIEVDVWVCFSVVQRGLEVVSGCKRFARMRANLKTVDGDSGVVHLACRVKFFKYICSSIQFD